MSSREADSDTAQTIDQIRRAQFPQARNGYEPEAVHAFLDEIAAWVEEALEEVTAPQQAPAQGGAARLSAATAAILTEAERAAAGIRGDAEKEAHATVERIRTRADETRVEAERYAAAVRSSAAKEVAEAEAEAGGRAEVILKRAKAECREMIEEATRRREGAEASLQAISERRTRLLSEAAALADELARLVAEGSGGNALDLPPAPQARKPGRRQLFDGSRDSTRSRSRRLG